VIPAKFEYEVAESVEHATELLGKFGGDAKLLAGGQSLLPLLKLRLAEVPALVNIGRLPDLAYVREDGDRVAIGALTRYSDLEHDETLARACPLLAHACGEVGDPQVRHMGTIRRPDSAGSAGGRAGNERRANDPRGGLLPGRLHHRPRADGGADRDPSPEDHGRLGV
jgi:xanthine dehydrogenase iron-sulfur cluster and FAD-binding subunit A